MPKYALIYNSWAGIESEKAEILEELSRISSTPVEDCIVVNFDAPNINSQVRQVHEQGCTVVVAAGGDGTIGAVAGAIVELALPLKLGVIAAGTFNHFAHDLGIPDDPKEAFDIIARGKTEQIDIGKVNSIYFVNNSALGLYPRIVEHREKLRKRGWHKTLAFLEAARDAATDNKLLTLEFQSENNKIIRTTPLLFIGNNKYVFDPFDLGVRKRLDEGILSIGLLRNVSRAKLVVLLYKMLIGRLPYDKDFNMLGLRTLTITSRKRFLNVSHDGEISRLAPPLYYHILPKALTIIIP